MAVRLFECKSLLQDYAMYRPTPPDAVPRKTLDFIAHEVRSLSGQIQTDQSVLFTGQVYLFACVYTGGNQEYVENHL